MARGFVEVVVRCRLCSVTKWSSPSSVFRDDRTRTRRDHRKYLTLIRTVALLHQHQRPIRSYEHHGKRLPYIDVTLADIAIANALSHSVLGRSLDELPPHSRRLLGQLDVMVTAASQKAG